MRFELDLARLPGAERPGTAARPGLPAADSRAASNATRDAPASSDLSLRLRLGGIDVVPCATPVRVRKVPVLRTEVGGPSSTMATTGGALREALDGDASAQWLSLPRPAEGLLVVPIGTRIVGDCRARHVWVRGEVTGRVTATAGLLVVDAGARVLGGVEGNASVVIAGAVAGGRAGPAVIARGRLDLACTAVIHGSVHHGVVAIYEGATVHGQFVPVEA